MIEAKLEDLSSRVITSAKRKATPLIVGAATLITATGFKPPEGGDFPIDVVLGPLAVGVLAIGLAYNIYRVFFRH